jgi:hypothetical protein
MTQLGERVALPEFGSKLHELVFNQNDQALKALARTYVVDAIRRWEPRITITRVDIEAIEHEFKIRISYSINETSTSDSLILIFAREA